MAVSLKYTGAVEPYFETAITGKPQGWRRGGISSVSDADAALLLATNLFVRSLATVDDNADSSDGSAGLTAAENTGIRSLVSDAGISGYWDGGVTQLQLLEDFARASEFTVVTSSGTFAAAATGVVQANAIKMTTAAAAGQNAYGTKDLTFNLNTVNGIWLHMRLNLRAVSASPGVTLYTSDAAALAAGTGRFSAALPSTTALLVGKQMIWVPKTQFTTLDGAPSFVNNQLSYRVRLDSTSTDAKDDDFLGLYTGGGRPTVIITTDDGRDDALWLHEQAQKRGMRLTHYLIAEKLGAAEYLTLAQAQAMKTAGDYMGLHGENVWTTTSRIASDISNLTATGVSDCKHAAYPLGDIGYGTAWTATRAAMEAAGVLTARISASSQTPTLPGFVEPMALPTYPLSSSLSLANAQAAVDAAISSGGTVIFYGHKFAGAADAETWTQADAISLLDYINLKRMAKLVDVTTIDRWWASRYPAA